MVSVLISASPPRNEERHNLGFRLGYTSKATDYKEYTQHKLQKTMGQAASNCSAPVENSNGGGRNTSFSSQPQQQHHPTDDPKSQNIQNLINFAKTNYQENPTESLAALLQALQMNGRSDSSGAAKNEALDRLRTELGDDIANHIGSHHQRMERALRIIDEMLQDDSTILFEDGRQDLLRQTIEDGSSVVCTKCNDVVASTRWQQHQDYWCQEAMSAMEEEEDHDNCG
jgi:hypothetical protein